MSKINDVSAVFDEFISEGVSVVDFWATWCGPCRMIAPIIEEIANEQNDIKVCKVNVDEEPELASRFKIYVIPTLVVVKNNAVTVKSEGFKSKEDILKLIEK